MFYFDLVIVSKERKKEVEEEKEVETETPPKKYYYNPEQQFLEHFRFPEIFLRCTKSAYISIVDKQLLQIAQKVERKIPTSKS